MKRFRALMLAIIIACSFMTGTVFAEESEPVTEDVADEDAAAGKVTVVETATGSESISVYAKGTTAGGSPVAQVGTADAKSVKSQEIQDLDLPMKTLVMVDNSISIREADRKKIIEFLNDIIADRLAGEQIAIATFSETTTYLCEYTDDYAVLKDAVGSLEYNDQETYLTDVLCELLENDFSSGEDVYNRIIIISDGMDNKSLGKTRDDLQEQIRSNKFPIYSIGCYNSKKSNEESLKNMFSISRLTNADSFLLDSYEKTTDIAVELRKDRNVVKYTVVPADNQMDGSEKAVRITDGNSVIEAQCKMPQKTLKIEPEVTVEKTEEPASEPAMEPVEQKEGTPWLLIAIGAGILAVIIIILVIIIVLVNKNKDGFTSIREDELRNVINPQPVEMDPTEVLFPDRGREDGPTEILATGRDMAYHIILTDINSPARTVQKPLTNSITIGRMQGCDIVFDHDRSVSSRHCTISVRDGHFFLKDLQSSNGTLLNNSKVLNEVELFSGNEIQLGHLRLRFEVR